jgi:hypothetical protein
MRISICSPTLQEKRKLEEAEDVLSSLEHDTNPETVPRQWIFLGKSIGNPGLNPMIMQSFGFSRKHP